MISSLRLALAALFLAVSATATAQMPATIDGQPVPSLAPLVERASPAVVNIRVSATVQPVLAWPPDRLGVEASWASAATQPL